MDARGRSPATAAGPPGASPARGRRVLRAMASLRLTLVIMALLGAAILWAYDGATPVTWALAPPLALLALNLTAAILSNPVFRRDASLMVFHVALLAVVVLAGVGRLTYLKGWAEVAGGTAFDGRLTGGETGPLHPWGLRELVFVNEGFEIDYAPGPRRGETRNRVRWQDEEGVWRAAVIGDQEPLIVDGYRFYTSHNKGFAPLLAWQPNGGEAARVGTVHLPSYPAHELRQTTTWQPPGAGQPLWLMLSIDEPILAPDRASQFRVPERQVLVVRQGEQRHELSPGDRLVLDEGVLSYQGLRAWMGYKIYWDPTLPWLLAACLVAVGSLGWHFAVRFASRPWHSEPEAGASRPAPRVEASGAGDAAPPGLDWTGGQAP